MHSHIHLRKLISSVENLICRRARRPHLIRNALTNNYCDSCMPRRIEEEEEEVKEEELEGSVTIDIHCGLRLTLGNCHQRNHIRQGRRSDSFLTLFPHNNSFRNNVLEREKR